MQLSTSNEPGNQILAVLGFHKISEPPTGHDQTWFTSRKDVYQLPVLPEGEQLERLDLAGLLEGLSCPQRLPCGRSDL